MNDSEHTKTGLVHNTDELRKLIVENPDLPIVVLSGVKEYDGNGSWYCYTCNASIGEFLDCEQTINDQRAFDDRDEFKEEVEYSLGFAEELTDEQFDKRVEEIMAEFEPYWKKCILVYVDAQ